MVVQSSLQPAPVPPPPTPTPPSHAQPHPPASCPRSLHSKSQRHSSPLPRLRKARRSRSRSLRPSRHHSYHRRSPIRPPRTPSRQRRRSPSPRKPSHRRDRDQSLHPKHRRTPSRDRRRSPRRTTRPQDVPVRRVPASSPPTTVYLQKVSQFNALPVSTSSQSDSLQTKDHYINLHSQIGTLLLHYHHRLTLHQATLHRTMTPSAHQLVFQRATLTTQPTIREMTNLNQFRTSRSLIVGLQAPNGRPKTRTESRQPRNSLHRINGTLWIL